MIDAIMAGWNPFVMALLERYIFLLLSCNFDFFLQFASVSISFFSLLSSTCMTHFLVFNLSIKVFFKLMEEVNFFLTGV